MKQKSRGKNKEVVREAEASGARRQTSPRARSSRVGRKGQASPDLKEALRESREEEIQAYSNALAHSGVKAGRGGRA